MKKARKTITLKWDSFSTEGEQTDGECEDNPGDR